jgi:precorrin isomerase
MIQDNAKLIAENRKLMADNTRQISELDRETSEHSRKMVALTNASTALLQITKTHEARVSGLEERQ